MQVKLPFTLSDKTDAVLLGLSEDKTMATFKVGNVISEMTVISIEGEVPATNAKVVIDTEGKVFPAVAKSARSTSGCSSKEGIALL